MSADSQGAESAVRRRIAFHGGIRTVLGFGAAVAVMAVLSIVIGTAVSETSFPAWVGPAAGVGKFALLAGITLLVLRIEGVRPAELGLSARHLGSALLAGLGAWVLLNLLVAALAVASGAQWGLAQIWAIPTRWAGVPMPLATTLLYDLLVVALVEEFVFRGYLQTKMVALLGDGTRPRIGLGILTASVVFGLLHAPAAIVRGASLSGVVGTVAFLGLSGLGFGLLYELTHNVYFVALLHAIGNTWPLVADVWTWSGIPLIGALVAVAVAYLGVTVAYRHRTAGTDRSPAVHRTDPGRIRAPARDDAVDS